jgi:hypothetical protein
MKALGDIMRLKQHREDVRELKSCGHVGIAGRYRHLISWAEAVLDEVSPNVVTMERRERKVVEDGK